MSRPARGFTLIEVMVALAVVAIALGAGLRAAGAVTDNADRLQAVIAAQWCAENTIVNLRLARQVPDVGETDFVCTQLGRELTGKLRSQATPNPIFRRVEAVVRDADGHELTSLATVLGRF